MSAEELKMPMPWGHIAAKAWGSPKDKRVLVVHGILDNAGTFDRLIPLLPQGYYFVCIDLPGHGLSSHFPAGMPLDFMNYILSIRRVLDYLKWETCIYIAHSLGANLGLLFSAIYPGRITKILCLDAITSRPISNNHLTAQIRRVNEGVLSIIEKELVPLKLYSEEEVMYMLMNLRGNTLNVAAAEALMKRSVTRVGDKYKLNRDPRLKFGLLPLFDLEQHLTVVKELDIPVSIILSWATLSTPHNKGVKKLLLEMSLNPIYNFIDVEGNHDVHNNNPERVAPHVCKFLGSIKSSL